MYKVLREVVEDTSSGTKGQTTLQVGGRVRSPAVKALLAKQLSNGLQTLEGQGQMDLKTGRIASKKAKKEKTPAQAVLSEVKTLFSKFLDFSGDRFVVRNSFQKPSYVHISFYVSQVEEGKWGPTNLHQGTWWPQGKKFRGARTMFYMWASRPIWFI